MLGEVVSWSPEKRLIARRTLSLEDDLWLADHTLGRRVSLQDQTLRGLPIVPFTFSIEMLAEAGAILRPDLQLVEMTDLRTYRWIAVEEEPVTLQVEAEALPDGWVRAWISRSDEEAAGPIVEGLLTFAPERPTAFLERPPVFRNGGASQWRAQDIYRTGMFHGPLFRGVTDMALVAEDGARATVQVLDPAGLFQERPAAGLVTDPVLLDQPGQVVGLWTAETLDVGKIIFPYRLGRLQLFQAALRPGQKGDCWARIELLPGDRVCSNLDVAGPDGRLWLRMEEWEDLRFHAPEPFLAFLHEPASTRLSMPLLEWEIPGVRCARSLSFRDFPSGFLTAHGGIWEKALAHLVLNRAERRQWRKRAGTSQERLDWLLGQVAAKEAVCALLAETYGLTLAPADIELQEGPDGLLAAHGAWLAKVATGPLVSLLPGTGEIAAAASLAAEVSENA